MSTPKLRLIPGGKKSQAPAPGHERVVMCKVCGHERVYCGCSAKIRTLTARACPACRRHPESCECSEAEVRDMVDWLLD